jgi:hypothetical protein
MSTLFMGNDSARLGGRIHVDPEGLTETLLTKWVHTYGT